MHRVREQTFVSEPDGFERLSEWDYLSELGEIVHTLPNKHSSNELVNA